MSSVHRDTNIALIAYIWKMQFAMECVHQCPNVRQLRAKPNSFKGCSLIVFGSIELLLAILNVHHSYMGTILN